MGAIFEDFRLKVFAEVAASGSFSRAARALGISQPAVSQNVSELERLLSCKLFERVRGGVVLTGEGRVLLDYAGKILNLYSEASAAVSLGRAPGNLTEIAVGENTVAEVSASGDEIRIRIKTGG